MKCPYCGVEDSKVLESRPAREGEAVRRRRECVACGRRFTTFEAAEAPRLFVVKRSGAREEFRRDKVLRGLLVACNKRPVPLAMLEAAVERIERDLADRFEAEAPTTAVGELCLRELREIDSVAYVRFASVYQEFETVSDFARIIDGIDLPEPEGIASKN